MSKTALFDSHIHSCCSHDSNETLENICRSALTKGLKGISITDHANMSKAETEHIFEKIASSAAEVAEADARFHGTLRVFSGVEISESRSYPDNAQKLLKLADYDVVLGSVHKICMDDWNDSYSKIPFDDRVPEAKLRRFLRLYFSELFQMASHEDFDVLAHLSCPLRYINGKYRRQISIDEYQDMVEEILRVVIRRQKALEVNTSGINGVYESLMPDEQTLRRYYALGGRMLTLGSDAHAADRIGNAVGETVELLKEIGFSSYCYYQKRQPVMIPFK